GAYAVTFGWQLVGAFVVPDGRDMLSVAPHASVAHLIDRSQEISGIAVALVVLLLVGQRLRVLRGPARRVQGALLVAAAVTVTAVTAGGAEVAVLIHDPALLDEPALVESVRATAGLVLENERLAAVVRSQLAEVRASRGRIVAAADAERRRIERNLHDGAQQRLVTLSVALGLEASRADATAADVLSRAQDEVEQAIVELRELARGIHPTLLRGEG